MACSTIRMAEMTLAAAASNGKKNVMYGRDKMCPEAKNTQEGPLDDGIDEMADGSSEVRSVRCPR